MQLDYHIDGADLVCTITVASGKAWGAVGFFEDGVLLPTMAGPAFVVGSAGKVAMYRPVDGNFAPSIVKATDADVAAAQAQLSDTAVENLAGSSKYSFRRKLKSEWALDAVDIAPKAKLGIIWAHGPDDFQYHGSGPDDRGVLILGLAGGSAQSPSTRNLYWATLALTALVLAVLLFGFAVGCGGLHRKNIGLHGPSQHFLGGTTAIVFSAFAALVAASVVWIKPDSTAASSSIFGSFQEGTADQAAWHLFVAVVVVLLLLGTVPPQWHAVHWLLALEVPVPSIDIVSVRAPAKVRNDRSASDKRAAQPRSSRPGVGITWSVISGGELTVVLVWATFNGWHAYYWADHYDYLASKFEAQRVALVLGHLIEVNLGLQLLPVARNSVWCACFGLGFERAVRLHRWLGTVIFSLVSLHMFAWWALWRNKGFEGCFAMLASCPTGLGLWQGYAAYGCVAVLSAASFNWVRRNHFEVFWYLHSLFVPFLVFAVLHSQAQKEGRLIYYGLLSIVLYAIDRSTSFVRAYLRPVEVLSVTANAETGVTRLELRAGTGTPLGHAAGQYCFLNIPEVSAFQWHPFSVSSAPSSTNFTFHIKDMGQRQFTGKLHALALQELPISVRVDGPYGHPGVYVHDDFEHVVLVAGGIGVTPIAAMLGDILDRIDAGCEYTAMAEEASGSEKNTTDKHLRIKEGSSSSDGLSDLEERLVDGSHSDADDENSAARTNVKNITVVWVVREEILLEDFRELILRARGANGASIRIVVNLYATASRGSTLTRRSSVGDLDVKESLHPIQGQRPNMEEIMREAAARRGSSSSSSPIGVFLCGPAPMVSSAKAACKATAASEGAPIFTVHEETFLL